jgi:hypothetical protein
MQEAATAELQLHVELFATARPRVREWGNPSRNHQVDPSIGSITLDAYRAWDQAVVLRGRCGALPTTLLLTTHYSLLTRHSLLPPPPTTQISR